MRHELSDPLIEPFLPQGQRSDGPEGVWMRAFVQARLAVLALGLVLLPLLLIAPDLAAHVMPVLLAVAASAAAGLTGLRYRRPAEAIALSAGALLILAAGPWQSAMSAAAAMMVLAGLAVDWAAAPRAVRQTPWLIAALAVIGLVFVVDAVLSRPDPASLLPALALLVAPVVTLLLAAEAHADHLQERQSAPEVAAPALASVLAAEQTAVLVMDRGAHVIDQTIAAHRLLGEPVNGLAGREFVDRVLIADRPLFLKALSDAIVDGRPATLGLRVAVGDGPAGRRAPPDFLAVDVTIAPGPHRETAGVALRAAAADSDTAREREQRDDLCAALSHEVRTPMNAILGFSAILANPATQPDNRETVAEYARMIHASANNAFAVSQALADLVRLENPGFVLAPEPVDVLALVSGLMSAHAGRAGRGKASHSFACDDSAVDAWADPQALRMLFSNIIEGVASTGGDNPHLACRLTRTDGRIEFVATGAPVGADSGAQRHEACLGLVEILSRRLARLMGGDLGVSSNAGAVVIRVALPLAEGVTRLPGRAAQPFSPVSLRKSA